MAVARSHLQQPRTALDAKAILFKTAIRSLVRENESHDAGRGTNHDFAQYIFYRQRPVLWGVSVGATEVALLPLKRHV
jgi:hypothetical protein